jgi:hypothetical protein
MALQSKIYLTVSHHAATVLQYEKLKYLEGQFKYPGEKNPGRVDTPCSRV